MTKDDFVKTAKNFGYDEMWVEDILEAQEATGIPLEQIAIEKHIAD